MESAAPANVVAASVAFVDGQGFAAAIANAVTKAIR
jgi:hypothetical protein